MRSHRIERVSHRDDTRNKWNPLVGETVRVAAAIPAFMMVPYDRNHRLQMVHGIEHFRAMGRVRFDVLEFVWRQLAGFAEDRTFQDHFPNVMEWGADLQVSLLD